MTPLGSLISGGLANKYGAVNTFIFSGILCVAASLIFLSKLAMIRKIIHPIYEKIEIIPDVDPVVDAQRD
jgi:arginine exporter protein ArgO